MYCGVTLLEERVTEVGWGVRGVNMWGLLEDSSVQHVNYICSLKTLEKYDRILTNMYFSVRMRIYVFVET